MNNLKNINCKKALLEGAKIIVGDARLIVPVVTGYLRDSIHSEETDNGAEVRVDADYASFVEFGTYKMRAHPFIRPAVDINKSKIENKMKEIIEKEVKEKI